MQNHMMDQIIYAAGYPAAATAMPPTSSMSTPAKPNQAYSKASQHFIRREYRACLQSINQAVGSLPVSPLTAWFQRNQPAEPSDELRRKIGILLCTFVATAWSSAEDAKTLNSALKAIPLCSELQPLRSHISNKESPAKRFVSLVQSSQGLYKGDVETPPSVMVALALAGVRLSCPSIAQGTVQEYLNRLAQWPTAQELLLDSDSDSAAGAADDTEVSISNLTESKIAGSKEGDDRDVQAFHKLLSVYAITLAPRVAKMDASIEFLESLQDRLLSSDKVSVSVCVSNPMRPVKADRMCRRW